MSDEDLLREALLSEALRYQPDPARIKARFDAGTQDQGARRSFRRAEPAGRRAMPARSALDLSKPPRSTPGSKAASASASRPVLRPLALVAAVVGTIGVLLYQSLAPAVFNRPGGLVTVVGANSRAVPGGVAGKGGRGDPSSTAPRPVGPVGGAGDQASGGAPSIRPTVGSTATRVRPAGPSSSAVQPAPVGAGAASKNLPAGPEYCHDGDGVAMSPYWLYNNQWAAGNTVGSQCVRSLQVPGPGVGWSTTWNWAAGSDQTKSYASVVLGWHWGWKQVNTGLPLATAEGRDILADWKYAVTERTAGGLQVAYNLWFHNLPPGAADSPSAEVNIVLYQSGITRGGTKLGTFQIDGAGWDLYQEPSDIETFTFVRTASTTASAVNLREFVDLLRTDVKVTSMTYLSSIEGGIDVANGSGSMVTSSYSVRLR